MANYKASSDCSFRIALIIDGSSLIGQRLMSGLCRRATASPSLLVRRFFADALIADGIARLIDWQPDAFVVYCDNTPLLQDVRAALPNAPLVAMNAIPSHLVEAIVCGSADEVITLSIKHFVENQVNNHALFFAGDAVCALHYEATFRKQLTKSTKSFNFSHSQISIEELQQTPTGTMRETIGAWLSSLPKPVGIFCPCDHSAAYLVRVCNHLGFNIPKEVQVIGSDELDESLECQPHLTCIHNPAERTGEIALKTTLGLLQGNAPEKKTQPIEGATLVPQGSTGFTASQLSDVPAAIAYIESHATQGITVNDVQKHTQSVSRMTFYRDFQKQTGDSPAHYIRRIRLAAASRLLSSTKVEITRIAELSGFSSSNYFAQVFRRETGMTPNQYRKSLE